MPHVLLKVSTFLKKFKDKEENNKLVPKIDKKLSTYFDYINLKSLLSQTMSTALWATTIHNRKTMKSFTFIAVPYVKCTYIRIDIHTLNFKYPKIQNPPSRAIRVTMETPKTRNRSRWLHRQSILVAYIEHEVVHLDFN